MPRNNYDQNMTKIQLPLQPGLASLHRHFCSIVIIVRELCWRRLHFVYWNRSLLFKYILVLVLYLCPNVPFLYWIRMKQNFYQYGMYLTTIIATHLFVLNSTDKFQAALYIFCWNLISEEINKLCLCSIGPVNLSNGISVADWTRKPFIVSGFPVLWSFTINKLHADKIVYCVVSLFFSV